MTTSMVIARPSPADRCSGRGAGAVLLLAALSVATALALPTALAAAAVPALAIANVALCFLVVLWRRDGALPVFEVGTVCVAFTMLYTAYPLFAYVLAGGTWTEISDSRLLNWAPDPASLGAYSWRSVAYLAAFAAVYLAVRGRASAALVPMRGPSRTHAIVLLWLLLLLAAYFAALWVWFGVTYSPSYTDIELGRVRLPQDLPYVLQQISHNARGVLSILKLCGIAFLLQQWRHVSARLALVAWLGLEVIATALRMGARTEAVVLLLGCVLLYHRIVRPLRVRQVALALPALIAAALLFGIARDFMRGGSSPRSGSYWSAANEFQILMGTGYDLHMRRATGALAAVPWQVHAADALRVVPSQLLGVPKIEPADWYLQQLGLDGRGVGLMFGVMGQAAVGYGTLELVARGAVLGLIFAMAHRLYSRRAAGFWVSMLYLYLCLWSYYTVRASSFYFVYAMVYRFLPTMIFVLAAGVLVSRAARRASAA